MMLKPLEILDRTLLRPGDYVLSLAEAGLACGLIDSQQLSRLRQESLALLAAQAKRQTQGDSTSLRVERAQHLLASILYSVGVALKEGQTPEAALVQLAGEPLESLYHRGLSLIRRALLKTRMVHQRLTAELFQTPNTFYQATLGEGMAGFFKRYDPETGAQETHITADYPTSRPLNGLTGIEFIAPYGEALYYENKLLRCFPPEAVHRVLLGVHGGYAQIPLNLYEPVLAAALGCQLTGRPPRGLGLGRGEIERLAQLFTDLSQVETARTLAKAWQALRRELAPLPGLANYVAQTLPRLAAALKGGARIFHLPAEPRETGGPVIVQGESLSDEAFRALAEEVAQCRYPSDQLALIHQRVRSLDDLEALLLAGCLGQDALTQLADSLSTEELALLLSRRLGDEASPSCREEEHRLCQALRESLHRRKLSNCRGL